MSGLLDLDLQVLRFINLDLSAPWLTSLMMAVTDKHNWYPFILAGVIILLFAGRRLPYGSGIFSGKNPRVYILGLILSVAIADQAGGFLKDAVDRTRPNRDPEIACQLNLPITTGGRKSFPSNHSANSAAMAVFTALVYPPLWAPALLFAGLVGLSRVYLGVHYPLDVLAGWLLGAVSGWAAWLFLRRRVKRPGLIGLANRFRWRQHQETASPGAPWKDASWVTGDGHHVAGWILEGSEDLVIFIHGLGGSALSRTGLGEKLNLLGGCSVLLVPLRGSDGHPAKVTTGGVEEPHDILGALAFASSRGYSMKRTVLYGTSMGGSACLKAAAVAGRLLPSGIIVHGGFRDYFASAALRTGKAGAFLLNLLMPRRAAGNLKRFQPVYWLRNMNRGCTVQYIYGELDRVVPPSEGKALAEATQADHSLEILENRGHPTGANTADTDFALVLHGFVERCLRK